MQLNSKALAITFAVIWGGCVFLMALLNSIWPLYGRAFVDVVSSIYPGFHPGGIGEAVVGALYGALDGAVGGALLGWLYNRLSPKVPV